METTAEKITYLNTTKQNLKTVINTTGAGLTDESTFRSYANVLNDKILGAINGDVDLFEEYPKVSGNGTDLSLNGVVEGKMSITPQGASSQDGEPTPTTPVPVKSVTGENSVVLQNENLFDGVYYNTYTGGTSPYPYASANNTRSGIIKIQPNTAYTILKGTSNRFRMSEYEEYPVVGSSHAVKYIFPSGADAFTNYTLTTGNTTKYLVIQVTNESQENVPMTVVKGTVVPAEQIPHEEQNYQLSLGNIELNSSPDGTVRDGIVGKPNEWYKREYIGKVVLDGSESGWRLAGTDTNTLRFTNDIIMSNSLALSTLINVFMCNEFQKYRGNSGIGNIDSEGIAIRDTRNGFTIRILKTRVSDLSAFLTWLSEHNVIVYYALETPVDIPITDTTLINQLNDIYNNTHSYNGVTNITTTYEDGNEQMYLDIEALKDIEI